MRILYNIFMLALIWGCSSQSSEKVQVNNSEVSKDSVVSMPLVAKNNPKPDSVKANVNTPISDEKNDFDFLSGCDSLHIWSGGIQGTPRSDSTGPYIMAQCFANKSFDVIVYSNRDVELKEAVDFKNNTIRHGIEGAEYYAFVIPKTVPENPENEFDTYEYVFPSDVEVYKYFLDGWYLIKEEKVNSFEQLGRLKLNTIYKK